MCGVWIIGRTEVKGPDDVKNINALQERHSLTSLREWAAGRRNATGDNTYPTWPAYDVSNPLNFFALLNEGLKRNPPQGADLAVLETRFNVFYEAVFGALNLPQCLRAEPGHAPSG
jgi:hypothetical protein